MSIIEKSTNCSELLTHLCVFICYLCVMMTLITSANGRVVGHIFFSNAKPLFSTSERGETDFFPQSMKAV